jgi:hypothetical protein
VKRKRQALDDPVVREIREVRQRLWQQAGGTISGLLRLLDQTVPPGGRTRPKERRGRRSRRAASKSGHQ